MCTLLLWKRRHPRYSLIAAANRDEFLDRPATGPTRLSDDPLIVGGRDLTAGGTWLAVNEAGILVALTNRRGAGSHDPSRRSRGRLVLEVATSQSMADASERLTHIDARLYNPFIIVAADASTAMVASGGSGGLNVTTISDGAHAVTNWDLDSEATPKSVRARDLARKFSIGETGDVADDFALSTRIHRLLADHAAGSDDEAGLCVHGPASAYGTRSSSIVFLGQCPGDTRVYHAEGPACSSHLIDVTRLLNHESASPVSNR